MITIKTKEEIEKMRKAGEILAKIHLGIKDMIRPGITTMQIDAFAEKYMRDHGATPEQKGFEGFPYATCASVNDVICHGFPNHTPLKDGDYPEAERLSREALALPIFPGIRAEEQEALADAVGEFLRVEGAQ